MKKLVHILLFTLLLLPSLHAGVVKANQQKTIRENASGRGLILTPGIIYLSSDKGKTLTQKYQLINDNQNPQALTVYPYSVNFVTDQNGNPLPDTTKRESDNDFASWIKLESDFYTLDHRELKDFSFTVTIPSNATGGTHSALIIFPQTKQDSSQNNNEVVIKEQVGLVLFLTIQSDITFDARISNMNISDVNNKPKQSFFYGKANITIEIENAGNVYIRPLGNIFIDNGNISKPVETFDFNSNQFLVQQKNKRQFQYGVETNEFIKDDQEWFKKVLGLKILPNPGKYRFNKFFSAKFGSYNITYKALIRPAKEANLGNDKVIVTEKTMSIFILPIQFIFLGTIIVVIIILFVIRKFTSSSRKGLGKRL